MNVQLVARIADDFVYEGSSFTYQNINYDLFVDHSGHVASCTCPDRTYRPSRVGGCKHMKALQRTLDAHKAQAQEEKRQAEHNAAFNAYYAKLEAQRTAARKEHSFSLLA